MTAEALDLTITQPGVYDGLPASVYHADPVPGGSLSQSGAKNLLEPHCPAYFKYVLDHPVQKQIFDFGKAAHKVVLGDLDGHIRIIEFPTWQYKKAQQEQAEARANGIIPVLREEYEQVQEMAKALRAHPFASRLFDPDRGKPEQSLFWQDRETGVQCRCRLDWLPDPIGGRLILPDYKTCLSAHREKFRKAAADYRYHMQDSWYRDGVRAVGLDDEPAFVFVAQEKKPPYLVNVVELTEASANIGRNLNRNARLIYAECVANDRWPSYSDEVELIDLPAWYMRQHDEEPET